MFVVSDVYVVRSRVIAILSWCVMMYVCSVMYMIWKDLSCVCSNTKLVRHDVYVVSDVYVVRSRVIAILIWCVMMYI